MRPDEHFVRVLIVQPTLFTQHQNKNEPVNLLPVLTDQGTRKFFHVDYGAWMTAFLPSTLCLHNLSSLSLLLIDVILDLALAHMWENQLQAFYADPVGVRNTLFNDFLLRSLPLVTRSFVIYWE